MASSTSSEIELELTYLARELPNLNENFGIRMEDVYYPSDPTIHPRLRLRRKGGEYELTKKVPIGNADASRHIETTIPLSAIEYESLAEGHVRRVAKTRYVSTLANMAAEIDVFSGPLKGLVLIDFEFGSEDEMRDFRPPAECLADVTQEDFIAGGLLAGKSYSDIEKKLSVFGYRRI
ncbi:hypothetical protein [Mycobacteroides saopaulense]|uniref:hypothetical protein n=1 Tax=Mycobacteroides saopaulense TaxID=1578165 RepID=UPI001041D046|nr:hypothetical protein [Mycobacteroides saopaulense]